MFSNKESPLESIHQEDSCYSDVFRTQIMRCNPTYTVAIDIVFPQMADSVSILDF